MPTEPPENLPPVARASEATVWLNEHALTPFLEEVRAERIHEIENIAEHVEFSLTELLQKADEEIGRAASEVEQKGDKIAAIQPLGGNDRLEFSIGDDVKLWAHVGPGDTAEPVLTVMLQGED